MLLTNEEIMDINQNADFDSAIGYARKIESTVLAKLKAQEPFGYYENGRVSITVAGGPKKWRERKAYKGTIYAKPLPPDDVVRDAERLDWLEKNLTGASDSERYLPFRVYWGDGRGIRKAIDAAMEKMK